jgi:hypothetical protein
MEILKKIQNDVEKREGRDGETEGRETVRRYPT